jgi:UDP-N-acetylglucosamine diphosphorylase/glucosamine-1-phosphate N-acetyltransferase
MQIILFDSSARYLDLLPLTYTRPIAALRCGILTLAEKWEKRINEKVAYLTENYLQEKFIYQTKTDNLYINSSILCNNMVYAEIMSLQKGEALCIDNEVLAYRTDDILSYNFSLPSNTNIKQAKCEISFINYPWNIFTLNHQEIDNDFSVLTHERKSQDISSTNRTISPENIFAEEGFKMEYCILNASKSKIYLGKNAEIMENTVVRGSLALCEGAQIKLSSKIYGATTLGPECRGGGEINNSVLQGYSNKGHDGFLGNAVIGEWCNLGADTNNSNLKNNYAEVKVWNHSNEKFIKTGLQFCGLIMGDHSKSGINTMFNTGTVVGVCANIFGSGFPRNFVPSYSWGGAEGFETFTIKKAFEVAERVMERRHIPFSTADKAILTHIFNITAKYRMWEHKNAE